MFSFRTALPLLAVLLTPFAAVAAEAPKGKLIKKCQDAAGKWHYGDNAAAECAKSKITEISQTGVKRKEVAAPPTEAELKQREAHQGELERERKLTEDRKRRDELLLSTYGHEDDIGYTRDRKLALLESSIKASEETLKSLRAALARLEAQAAEEKRGGKPVPAATAKSLTQTKNQIASHEAAIQSRRQEQDTVRKQAATDLARYRELRKAPAGKSDEKSKMKN